MPDRGRTSLGATGLGDVTVLVGQLSGGGQSRAQANLAEALAQRCRDVDLVFFAAPGPAPLRPEGVRIVDLPRRGGQLRWRRLRLTCMAFRGWRLVLWHLLWARRPLVRPRVGASRLWIVHSLAALVDYLACRRPAALFAAGALANMLAMQAGKLARTGTRVVPAVHMALTPAERLAAQGAGPWRWQCAFRLGTRALASVPQIVTVSQGIAGELAGARGIPHEHTTTIYNPVFSARIAAASANRMEHPWFQEGAPPVVLGVGRLVEQKDLATLLRAFAQVRRERLARLMILGEGELRGSLHALAERLGVSADVALPGFVDNPFAYLARATVFALTSRWEGLPYVLLEALACGCPVVSTDCRFGPAEILQDGRYGRLVPVGDDAAVAQAIMAMMDCPPPRSSLVDRARAFTPGRAAEGYLRCAGIVGTVLPPRIPERAPGSGSSGDWA